MAEPPTDAAVRVCTVDDLAEGDPVVVPIDGDPIAVILHDGEVYAVSNVCPHQGGPVGEGKVEDGCIHCPWHGWQFDLDTGEHVHGLDDLHTFAVSVTDGEVYVSS